MSRTAPGDAHQGWPYDGGRNQGYGTGQDLPGSEDGDMSQARGGYGYDERGHDGQAYRAARENGRAQDGRRHGNQAYEAQGHGEYGDQAYGGQSHEARSYGQGYGPQGYDQPRRQYEGHGDQSARQYRGYDDRSARQDQYRDPRGGRGQGYGGQGGYESQGYETQGYETQGYAGYDGRLRQQGYGEEEYGGERGRPYQGQGPAGWQDFTRRRPAADTEADAPGERQVRFRRLRRLARRRSVRIAAAVFGVFLVYVMFSAGQAAFKNNGQGFTANLAEWARDHYLGPIVTLGEWMTYQPPKTGGKPSFSYAVPKGEQITATKGKHKGFVPDIPPTVKLLAAGPAMTGEGQWRVVGKVKSEPAILITFLRDGGQYTSYSNGIASIDQRLVKFSLRPGTEDPGGVNWGVANYIPSGQRTGLLATFNGGFKLDSAGGGFYLNGIYHGTLVNGVASIVYYKNGTIKIGEWGRDFTMNSTIEGVRQNLKLLVDHGAVVANANSDVMSNWGATLGGGYWVWRSGIGITKDGRVIFVYGQALDAKDLGMLLKQAGAVEGMQMDINPEWMKFDYYEANGHPSDPTPMPLLPNQHASPYSYYTPSTRDFTAVFAR